MIDVTSQDQLTGQDPLQSGFWFNRSRRWLQTTAIAVGISWASLCAITAYFVAQFFLCIGDCRAAAPPFLLLAVSAFFGLIPGLGTAAIGAFIVKGLWDDAHDAEA